MICILFLLFYAEKFDYLRDIYDDILSEIDSRINEIVQSGVEGHEDELEQLHKQYEEYLNKKEDIFKDEIDYEIEHIEYLQDKYNDFIDKRIDRYEDEKKAVEDRYDAEIDKIDETINALKDKNDETQNAIDLKKAEQNLEKSRQRTRMTYGSDGTIIYKQDDEAIAEAQQKVDDIKFNMLIDSLEKQKEAVETEKDTALAKYDDMIAALNEQKDKQSTYYDNLIDILNAYLNPKATENIDSVWDRVLADKDKVQTNDGSTTVNGETIDTSEVDKGEIQADKVNEQLETTATILEQIAGSADDFVNTILKTLGATSVKDLWVYSSNSVPDGSKMLNEQHDTTQWSASRDNYTINNSNNEQPMSFSFGDINVNSPVGDSYDLAKELRMNLPNAFEKQMYSNLKKY